MKQSDKTMTTFSIHVLVFIALCGFAIAKSSYLISAPNLIRPGMTYGMTVSILKSNGKVNVKTMLISKSMNKVISSGYGTLPKGRASSKFNLQVPSNLPSRQYAIKIKGSGGLRFSRQTNVAFRENDILILIQTDKAIYSENQRVRFRVAIMHPNLKPYKGSLDIRIYDSKNTLIQQWIAVDSDDGVFATNFLINADPELGEWKIKVSAKGKFADKKIIVKRYVLPKFNVIVSAGPNYILNSGVPLVAKINASYTFGQPVHGTAIVQFIEYPRKKVIKEAIVNVHGTNMTSLPSNQIRSQASDIVVVAQLGETTSGTKVIGSTTVNIVKAVKFSFGPTRKAFSPGLPYTTFVKISSAIGSNISPKDRLSVRIYITKVTIKRCNVNRPYDYKTITTTNLRQNLAVGYKRNPKITFPTPTSATEIRIVVKLKGITETLKINADFTKSRKHIQIIPKAPSAKVGKTYKMDVKLSHTLNGQIIYQVISKGLQVHTGTVNCIGRRTVPLALKVTSAFVPKAHILVYAVYNREIVVDEIDINVFGIPSIQKIGLKFEKKVVKPGESVKLKVKGSPKSKVHVLAVDESVHILQSGYDISVADILHKLQSFEAIPPGYSGNIITKRNQGKENSYLKKRTWFSKTLINDADDIFRNSGMNVMSDAFLYDYDAKEASRISKMKTYCRPNTFNRWVRSRRRKVIKPFFALSVVRTGTNTNFHVIKTTSSIKKKPVLLKHQYTRKNFPETWLWETLLLSNAGSYTLEKTVPDTITSWRASAFSLSSGFGMTESVEKILVYLPLFVDLTLPHKVVENEKIAVKVSIYNYQPRPLMLFIRVSHTADPMNIDAHSAAVGSGQSKMKYFTLNARKSGISNVTVSVMNMFTFMEVDRIQKPMIIRKEGIEREYNKQHLVCVSKGSTFTDRFKVKLPPGYVPGSKRVYVTVSGDVNAPTIANLGRLLRRPTGCGEQTIISLAPNIFATKYLKATKQLKSTFKKKAIEHMIYGRDNELRWQRRDGSFSAWGNRDRRGSVWITAFVAMSFHQAQLFIHIEKSILTRAVDWLIRQQAIDGSFRETGRVIHVEMQGGTRSSKIAFTAYVLVCLMEIDDIPEYKNRINVAANKARRYIERRTSSINSNHALALCAYALKLVKSGSAGYLFKKLEKKAINRGQMRCWDSSLRKTVHGKWVSPNPRARPIYIETAGYALLYYTLDNNFGGGMKVLRWLISQRNPNGGFQSTQDTVVSLHAMAEFSVLLFGSQGSTSKHMLNIDITAGNYQSSFAVNSINKLQLQHENLPDDTKMVSIRGTGSGIAVVDVVVVYNIRQDPDKAAYKITTKILNETIDSIVVNVCASRKPGKSGMVVEEITLPSGFKADLTSIKNVNGLRQKEADFDKVALYFDSIGTTDVCVNMKADRVDKVIQSQTYPIEIYDYYDPRNQGIGNYTSGKLKNTRLCDICPSCYVCQHENVWG